MASSSSRGAALWRDSWLLFPCIETPEYHDPRGEYEVPKGSPYGYWAINSSGEKSATGGSDEPDKLIAEYSKLDPHKPAWWWFPGNNATFEHRYELKRSGCRWRRNRKAYSYVGDKLPDRLLGLLDNADECRAIMSGMDPEDAKVKYRELQIPTDEVDDTDQQEPSIDPCSLSEAQSILGIQVTDTNECEHQSVYKLGKVAWTTRTIPSGIEGRTELIPVATRYEIIDIDFKVPQNPTYVIRYGDDKIVRVQEEELIPKRIFDLSQTVYARQDNETADGKIIPTGHKGTIKKLYRYNTSLGQLRGHTYDVDWDGIGVEWMFEDELASDPSTPGIAITRREVTNFGAVGESSSDKRRAIIEHGAKPEEISVLPKYECSCEEVDGPKGWLPGTHPGTWIACDKCNLTGTNMPKADPANPDAVKLPTIRIIQSAKLSEDTSSDDEITSAIRSASKVPAPRSRSITTVSTPINKSVNISQEYVGELTGSVTAHVFCYGYATHAGKLIYLNMGGPRSGVEAIRSKLAKGDTVNLIPDDGPAIELTPGEGISGMYTAFINNMSEARFVSMLLVHEDWMLPNYGGKSTTYIMEVDEDQAKNYLLHHIRELVDVPVFSNWTDYLWQAGQSAMLLRSCNTGGGITLKSLDLDDTSWKRIITGGLANNIISIPQPTTQTA